MGSGILLEYENGRVSKMIYTADPVYHYDTYFIYNEQGQLIRYENYVGGSMGQYRNYHYENGLMVSVYIDDIPPFERDSLFYDDAGNVTKHSRLMGIDNPRWIRDYFEYDDAPKPNFGIDYLFMYQPFPGMGTTAILEKGLSKNNMTKGIGETWVYTYNEYGLPKTIEHIPLVPPVNHLVLTITYKPIASNINEPVQSKFVVYPNPTSGQLTINNEQLTIDNIEIFDVFGRKEKGERRKEY